MGRQFKRGGCQRDSQSRQYHRQEVERRLRVGDAERAGQPNMRRRRERQQADDEHERRDEQPSPAAAEQQSGRRRSESRRDCDDERRHAHGSPAAFWSVVADHARGQ
jgi:hypothetical protein